MRLQVHVAIGGEALVDGETGSLELARLIEVAWDGVASGELVEQGDSLPLSDANGQPVGFARLVPDWTVGEEVWVTNEVGSLLKSTVHAVGPHVTPGYSTVVCRFIASHELLPSVVADAFGHDHHGRPVMGRVR